MCKLYLALICCIITIITISTSIITISIFLPIMAANLCIHIANIFMSAFWHKMNKMLGQQSTVGCLSCCKPLYVFQLSYFYFTILYTSTPMNLTSYSTIAEAMSVWRETLTHMYR